MKKTTTTLLLPVICCASLALLLLSGCSGPPIKVFSREKPVPGLLWPEPPSPARITYGGNFSTPEDLGIRKGLFTRITDFIFGRDAVHMVQPTAVITSPDGLVYVADPALNGIHRFDLLEHEYQFISTADEIALVTPVAFARGNASDIYFTDSSLGKVFVIDSNKNTVHALPLTVKLTQPTGLAFNPATGDLFVVDTGEHNIVVINEGKYIRTIGKRGAGQGEFNFPTMICLSQDGTLLVSDSLNFRVQKLRADGKFLLAFGQRGDASGAHARPKGIAADQYGHIYLVDGLFHTVQLFDQSGNYLMNVGSLGQGQGEFWLPGGIFIDDRDKIFVADTFNHRVQVFYYIGGQS